MCKNMGENKNHHAPSRQVVIKEEKLVDARGKRLEK